MVALRLLVRVTADKRQELIQSLSSFVADESIRPYRRLVLQDLSDENLICWMGEWHRDEDFCAFRRSETYRALRGAAQVLGILEEVEFRAEGAGTT